MHPTNQLETIMGLLFKAVLCWMCLSFCGIAAAQDWVQGGGMLWQLDASTGAPRIAIPVKRIDAMASDGAKGIWYATPNALLHRDGSGDVSLQVDSPTLRLGQKISWMAADPYAAQIWVSDGERLLALDSSGEVSVRRMLSSSPIAMSVAQDQHLWLLEKHRLSRVRRDGSIAGTFDIRTRLQAEARHLVLDDHAHRIWIVGDRLIVAIDAFGTVLTRVALLEPSRGACYMLGTDVLWILTSSALEARGRDGQLRSRTPLASMSVSRATSIACNWQRQEIWVGHDGGLVRVSASGGLLAGISLQDVQRIEPVALRMLPKVELLRPPRDALSSDPRPMFELALTSACNGGPCPQAAGYLEGATVEAQVDAQGVGALFALDAEAGSAAYRPELPLAEGPHHFTAKLVDRFGHSSDSIEAAFTVDTVPPRFLSVLPEDGAIVDAASVVISGAVDDAQASVVLSDQLVLGGIPQPAPPGQFAWSVPLQPGTNVFTVTAVDRAGNADARTLRIVRVAGQVLAQVTIPSDGATVFADSVIVRGTIETSGQRAGVSVNGEPAVLIGDTFHAQVPLSPGANVLEIRVTTLDGQTATRNLTVTREGVRSFRAHAAPAAGIAPSPVRFEVSPTGARAVARIQVDYQGDGSIDFSTTNPGAEIRFVYTAPGVYGARVLVMDADGVQELHTVQVVVQDLVKVDQEVKEVLQSMLGSLRSGNVDAAVQAFAPSVRARYRGLFEAARLASASAVDSLGTVQDGSILGSMAEYVMVQDRPSGPKAYFVYLIKAKDGLWRIQQM